MEFMQSKKDKRIWIFVFLVLALLATGVVIMLGGKGEGYRIIKITEVSGQVSIVNNGIEYEAYPGMNLQENYALVTSADSYVRMLLDDDKYIKLEAGSRVVFEKLGGVGSGKTAIRLERGSMVNEITHPLEADESFVINTPNAILAVRGTFFRVNLDVLETGETITNVYTYGGKVASNRIMPDGEVVEEDVMIDAGYKAIINMREEDTIYVVDEDYSEKEYTMPISEEDISDEDMVDIHFSAENGHELFISTEEAQTYIEERNINLTEQISVYEMAAELEQKSSVPDDKRPLISTVPGSEEYQFGAPADGGKTEETSGGVKEFLCALIGHMEAKGGSEDCHTRCRICGSILSVTHSYTDTVTKEATTTTKGEITHSCDCGYSYTSEIPALASSETDTTVPGESAENTEAVNPVEGNENTEVPENIEGNENTGNAEITDVPATGNNQEAGEEIGDIPGDVADDTEEEDEPEEEEEGNTSDSNTSGGNTDSSDSNTEIPHTHSYTDTITTAATCTTVGEKTYTCTCGHSYTEEIPALGHTEADGGTASAHTVCSVCGETLNTAHSYTSREASAATCTTVGEKTYTCTCGHSYTEEIPALGHTEADGGTASAHTACSVCGEPLSTTHSYTDNETLAATCTAVGELTHSCGCGYSYTEEIPALGHTEADGGTAAAHTVCSVCGEPLSTAHSYTDNETLAATCTAVGELTHSCGCGYSYTEEIPALGHTEAAGGTASAHTACSVCGEPLSTAHSYTSSETLAATCTAVGELTYSCACGYSYTEETPALGHTEAAGGTAAAHTACSVCGEILSTAHSYTANETLAATCTAVGELTYSCGCGYSYTEEIPKLAHTEGTPVYTLEPTCTETGWSVTSCTVCGEVVREGRVDEKGHTEGTPVVVTPATCETAGNQEIYCADCNTYLSFEEIPATGHTKAEELSVTTCSSCGTSMLDFDDTNFPDQVFRSMLMADYVDADNDGVLAGSEITGVSMLDLSRTASMTDLTGIEHFTNLQYLDITGNSNIDSLPWSSLTNLQTVMISDTYIDSVPCASLPALQRLDAMGTPITAIDVSVCPNLTYLNLGGTNISSIDVRNNPALETLMLSSCYSITSVDLSNNAALTTLELQSTSITDFSLDGCAALQTLNLNSPVIESIEVKNCTSLTELTLPDNTGVLEALDISGCTSLISTYINDSRYTLKTFIASNSGWYGELDLENYSYLETVDISGSYGITDLNVRGCTALNSLNASNCGLAYLDITDCTGITSFNASGNNYTAMTETDTVDLTSMSYFDVNAVSNVSGGTYSDGVFTFATDSTEITYTYDCGNGYTETFTISKPF